MNKSITFGLIIIIIFTFGCTNEMKCEGEAGDSDHYYYKISLSNETYKFRYKCIVRSHSEDIANAERWVKEEEQRAKDEKIRYECYMEGKDYNITLDLKEDYGLSCEQIGYINDHLILGSERKDGGSMEYYRSGFFNSQRFTAQFYDWVNTEYLATGMLPKHMEYHEDCNGKTLYWQVKWWKDELEDTMNIEHYTESDFVNYYVDNCIGGKQ